MKEETKKAFEQLCSEQLASLEKFSAHADKLDAVVTIGEESLDLILACGKSICHNDEDAEFLARTTKDFAMNMAKITAKTLENFKTTDVVLSMVEDDEKEEVKKLLEGVDDLEARIAGMAYQKGGIAEMRKFLNETRAIKAAEERGDTATAIRLLLGALADRKQDTPPVEEKKEEKESGEEHLTEMEIMRSLVDTIFGR